MAPIKVVILRHGEKPENPEDPDLSPEGKKRAEALASLIKIRYNPDFLFAAAGSKHSNRCVETLKPLADACKLSLDKEFSDEDYDLLADNLLHDSGYESKAVIICWHHGHIPDLAMSLGVPDRQMINADGMIGLHWNPEVFDRFWIISFGNSGANLEIIKQDFLLRLP